MCSNTFPLMSLEFSMYSIVFLPIMIVLLLIFLFGSFEFIFSYLTAKTRTSNTLLNISDEWAFLSWS